MNRSEEMGQQPVGKLLWKYFVPAFVGVFVNSLYNIVDRIFIGNAIGVNALSGLSVVFPIMLIFMGFGMLVGLGSGVLVSINLGKRNKEEAERVLGNAISLLAIISVFLTGIGLMVAPQLLKSFGATAETLSYANEYLEIILYGVFFQQLGFSLNNVIRSEGNARIAMVSMLISALTNIILDALFIYVFKWGVKGAALATILSMMVLSIWVMVHFKSHRSVIHFYKRNLPLKRHLVKGIFAIGMAPFAMQVAASGVQALFNTQLIHFGGDVAVGAMGVINSVTAMVVMSMVAINMAAQPIVGFNFGAKNYHRVKATLWLAIKAATLFSIVSFIGIQVGAEQIVKLFNNQDTRLLDIGSHGLRIFAIALPIVGYQVVAGNYFQAVGKARISMILTLMRQVFILFPALFILPKFFGLDGVWFSGPVSDTASAILSAFFLIKEWHHLTELEKKQDLTPVLNEGE